MFLQHLSNAVEQQSCNCESSMCLLSPFICATAGASVDLSPCHKGLFLTSKRPFGQEFVQMKCKIHFKGLFFNEGAVNNMTMTVSSSNLPLLSFIVIPAPSEKTLSVMYCAANV